MKLNQSLEKEKELWEQAGYKLPNFDRRMVKQKTKEAPFWIHFGAGNIFRAFLANVVQTLLNDGVLDRGLIAAEGYDYEIIEKMNRPHEDYSILVTLKADGTIEKTVIGSIVQSYLLDSENEIEYYGLKEIFENDSLQIASFTITEKGYCLTNSKGEVLPDVKADFAAGPKKPASYLGKITSLLYTRYLSGEKPIALVSMDNCSHNGDRLYEAVKTFAEQWTASGKTEQGFLEYIIKKEKVSFPWTMIDKITPRPDSWIEELLKKDNIEELQSIITSQNTYVASFVNTEECEYLVIEDWFPNGRPELEKGGILFTDRETVDRVEKMKVCTCLNPIHTTLAVFGCLLGYRKISDEMKDEQLKKIAEVIGYQEGLPVVSNPNVLDPKEFLDTVLKIRIPNPFMPDTPQRIATDTSQKLSIRFGETIKAYLADPKRQVQNLKMIPLVFAGWLRYLMAIDDEGNEFTLSPDPMLDTLCPYLLELKTQFGNVTLSTAKLLEKLEPILRNEKIFGVDLLEAGMAQMVGEYLKEMLTGKGAVRAVLKKYTAI